MKPGLPAIAVRAHGTDGGIGPHAGPDAPSVTPARPDKIVAMQRHEELLLVQGQLLLLPRRPPRPLLPDATADAAIRSHGLPARFPPPEPSPERHGHGVQPHELGHHAGLAPHHAFPRDGGRQPQRPLQVHLVSPHAARERRARPRAGGAAHRSPRRPVAGVITGVAVAAHALVEAAERRAVHGVPAVEREARVLAQRVPRRPEHVVGRAAAVDAGHAPWAPALLRRRPLPRRRAPRRLPGGLLLQVQLQDHLLKRDRRRTITTIAACSGAADLGLRHARTNHRRRRRRHGNDEGRGRCVRARRAAAGSDQLLAVAAVELLHRGRGGDSVAEAGEPATTTAAHHVVDRGDRGATQLIDFTRKSDDRSSSLPAGL